MDFSAFVFGIALATFYFWFWAQMLTRTEYFGNDSSAPLYHMLIALSVTYLVGGFTVSKNINSLLNILLLLVLLIHSYALGRKEGRGRLNAVECGVLLTFLIFSQVLLLGEVEKFFGTLNAVLLTIDLGVVYGRPLFYRLKGNLKYKEMLGIRQELQKVTARNADRVKNFHPEFKLALITIMEEESDKWFGFPDEVQDLYFMSEVKRLKKVEFQANKKY